LTGRQRAIRRPPLSQRRIFHHLRHPRHRDQGGGGRRRDHAPRVHRRGRRHLHLRR